MFEWRSPPLQWPASTSSTIGLFSLNALALDAARPECMASADVPLYYPVMISKIAAPLLFLSVLFGLRLFLQAIDKGTRPSPTGAPAVTDRLELLETVLFHVQVSHVVGVRVRRVGQTRACAQGACRTYLRQQV